MYGYRGIPYFFVLHLTLQQSVLKKAFFKMRVTICGSLQE